MIYLIIWLVSLIYVLYNIYLDVYVKREQYTIRDVLITLCTLLPPFTVLGALIGILADIGNFFESINLDEIVINKKGKK